VEDQDEEEDDVAVAAAALAVLESYAAFTTSALVVVALPRCLRGIWEASLLSPARVTSQSVWFLLLLLLLLLLIALLLLMLLLLLLPSRRISTSLAASQAARSCDITVSFYKNKRTAQISHTIIIIRTCDIQNGDIIIFLSDIMSP
jgi:uncharacterized BrkB/YihY/UPF0761 family membrane protein